MDHATIFLLGVYLVPLAFLSLIRAWADSRRPGVALFLGMFAAGCIGYVAFTREEGLFGLREIPELTFEMAARIAASF